MIKRFFAMLLVFITVFNFTVFTYNKSQVLGADMVVVGGTVIATKTIVEWTLGMLAAVGCGFAVEHKEDIQQSAINTAKAYTQYISDRTDVTVDSGRITAEYLTQMYNELSVNAQKGITKGIAISSDIYNTFKQFVRDYFDSPTEDLGIKTIEGVNNAVILSGYSENVSSNYYNPSTDTSRFVVISSKVYNPDTKDFVYSSSFSPYVTGSTYASKNVSIELQLNKQPINTADYGNIYQYSLSCKIRGYYNDKAYASTFNIPWLGTVGNAEIYINPSIPYTLTNGTIIENNDLPTWKKVLTDNNDVIFNNNSAITDNYDVIWNKSLTKDDNGVFTGNRAIDLPNVGAYENLQEKYINGELTWQEFMNAVQKLTGITSLDGAGVIDTDGTLTIPADTPVIGGVGVNDEDIGKENIFESSFDDVISSSSYSGFPDLSTIFPFCIPFDLIRILKLLTTTPEIPHFEVPFNAKFINLEYTFVIDFEQFSTLAQISRTFFTIIFIISLILLTRRIIKG